MSAGKNITIFGMTCLNEASYNAGGSPAAGTDGVQLAELPQLTIGYAYDGARAMPPGTQGYQPKVAPGGRTGTGTFRAEPKGGGAAYSASVTPNVHKLLRAAGFDAALSTTSGSEKYTYTPTPGPTGYASLVANLYARGELYPLTGIYADLTIGADGPVVPIAEFAIQGLLGAITDIAVPAIAYPLATIDPPKAASIQYQLGSFTTNAIVRKWSLKFGREISPRLNQNSGGHAGFSIGRRTPQLEVTFETPALVATPFHSATGVDPYNLFDAATSLAVSLQVGSVQYNRYKFTFPAAQVMAPPVLDADGPTALTTLTLQLNPSALGSNNEIQLVFD